MKPVVGMIFKNISDGIEFYRAYAAHCGFDIRLGSRKKSNDSTVTWRYLVCNREGAKNASMSPDGDIDYVSKKRQRVSRRVRCMAHLVLKFSGERGYVVYSFEDRYSHVANIGPTTGFKLYNQAVGGYSNIGCTINDVKNFTRDLRAYIIGADVQMLLDNLYPICRRNFAAFGDSVSFDATYNTNRYKLVFTPFTGKDNHGKLVTFGAALLSSEDTEAYSWVLESFKICMDQSPSMLITDQDPALKKVVKRAFPDTRHQLCMWHIMLKVTDKVPAHLKKDKSFKDRINKIVWNDFLEPVEFEKKWKEVMVEFGLTEVSWFKSMYDARFDWISAYFRNHPLSGLCRTVSISESANSFYGTFVSPTYNLVEFFMKYDSALDAQRHAFDEMNSIDESSIPLLKTPILFEKHAANVYTTKIFGEVQKEIYSACFKCRVMSIVENMSRLVYKVDDGYNGLCEICSGRTVVLSHILIIKRFKVRFKRFDVGNGVLGYLVNSCAAVDENKILINTCISEFYACLGVVDGDKEKMSMLLRRVRELNFFFKEDSVEEQTQSVKEKLFSDFYGSAPLPKWMCCLQIL
ncbi:hypothetical protein C2S53_011700 [Perilla frutescens var. hirtella]|uniref:Protein FAR1-RELATED SEQUENCE n=1 Tax=Perilla frutescens var. hirtella TaxID=608512 RepID=A0AAD4IZ72_PERFH|nr:hypothetical protein C2S53_011700 [Perilla frutescens var. hirtella]